jgi:hypothetical protein
MFQETFFNDKFVIFYIFHHSSLRHFDLLSASLGQQKCGEEEIKGGGEGEEREEDHREEEAL